MNSIISTSNLTKRYRGLVAVNDVSIEVPAGSICGLVGRNGAGKTTLMRIISGLIPCDNGSYNIATTSNRVSVAGIIEAPSLHQSMTAMDNLIIQCKLLGLPVDAVRLTSLLQLVDLERIAHKKASTLSLGMRQRLAIAIALVGNPSVLLLDEPTNGLDPQGISAMRQLFIDINATYGTTILISSHILSELAKFATHYIFMDNGRVVKCMDSSGIDSASSTTCVISTSDNTKAMQILTDNDYSAVSIRDDSVVIQGKHDATTIILLLAQHDITVSSLANHGESLEDYFLSLIGGRK